MDFTLFIKKTTPLIFDNTKEMMLWHYSKYLETNDLKYFSNYYDIKNPKEPNPKLLDNALTKIFGEILEKTQNYSVIERFNNIHKINKLKTKYEDVTRLILAIRMHDIRLGMDIFKQLVSQLEQWNYRIDNKKDVFTQLDKIEKRVQGIKSEIESLSVKLRKDQGQEKKDIEEIKFHVEQGLEMNYPINMKTTSLFTWILMQKKLERKIDLMNRQNAKK